MNERLDVGGWLASLKLEALAEVLEENAIQDKQDLLNLSTADVKEMVPQIGLRNKLLKGLSMLRDVSVPRSGSGSGSGSRSPRASMSGRRSVSRPKRSTTPTAVPKAAYIPPTVPPLDNTLNVNYVSDRKRRDVERKSRRDHVKREEHERWLELLKRTVKHPTFPTDEATVKRRKDMERKEQASRRSLSASMHRHHSMKKDREKRQPAFTPSAWQRSTSPTAGKRPPTPGATLYRDIATAYTSLMPGSQRDSASPARRRVWCRSNDHHLLTQQPLTTPVDIRSPSPPPPPGSPSPEKHAVPATTEPVPQPAPALTPVPCRPEPQLTGDESPEQQRERLLQLIEDNKQQRIRYWLPEKDE